ncbi:hypothetical protein SMALA_8256 [Streptomyces malaysiensis subsp. malaysiensis]|nr:hypothetical protein SMALA_8256 [Streptomyces malaysiensis]
MGVEACDRLGPSWPASGPCGHGRYPRIWCTAPTLWRRSSLKCPRSADRSSRLRLRLRLRLPANSPRLGVITAGVLLVTGTCLVGFHPPTTDRPSTMWMVAAEELGIAAGTVGAGALTQHMGAWPALLSAAVGGGLGALVIAARKTCLASSGKPPAAAPETP